MLSTWSTSSSSSASAVVALQLGVLGFLSLVGTLVNGLVFAVFYRRSSLRTLSNRFVLSLVLANLLCTLLSIPSHILDVVTQLPAGWHQSLHGLTSLVSLASVLSIFLISLDRYYAVNTPLHYSIIVTRRKSLVMIGSVWAVSLALSLPLWCGVIGVATNDDEAIFNISRHHPFNNSHVAPLSDITWDVMAALGDEALDVAYALILLLLGFVAPFTALCWLYFRMYNAALKNTARTRRQSLCSNVTTEAIHSQPLDHMLADPSPPSLVEALTKAATAAAAAAAAGDNRTSLRFATFPNRYRSSTPRWRTRISTIHHLLFAVLWHEEGRALRTTAMVITSFIGCWLPYFLCLVIDRQMEWIFAAKLAAFMNVLVSPAIYVYRNQVARQEAFRVLSALFCPCRTTAYIPSLAAPYPMSLLSDRLKVNSVMLSRRSSLLSCSESPCKGSAESNQIHDETKDVPGAAGPLPVTGSRLVVNWVRDGAVECQLAPQETNLTLGTANKSPRASSTSALPTGERRDRKRQDDQHQASTMRQRATTFTGALSENKFKRKDGKTTQQSGGSPFATETNAINYQTYPSLDFFDTGLEDFGRRAASFSRFVYQGGVQKTCSQTSARRARTSSFSRVLLSRHKLNKTSNPLATSSTNCQTSVNSQPADLEEETSSAVDPPFSNATVT